METVDGESFADLLRRLRRTAGLTQQELAERSGISVRAVSDLEREINLRPRRDTAAMLADGLSLTGPPRERFLAAARRRGVHATALGGSPLPEPESPLVGRARELAAIEHTLLASDTRLLTLTGPGGVGKTRLALETARRLSRDFGDGVIVVRLEGLSDPAQVLPALAEALQLRETGSGRSPRDRIAARLSSLDALIVLDNMEHLLPAAADLADVLRQAPQVRLLATSRESLRLADEHVLRVAPLPRPDPAAWRSAEALSFDRAPAMALFAWHALAVRSDLTVDPAIPEGRANLTAIAEICYRLDGLPLAIELAAAQVEVFSPAALLALLENAGLPLLAGGSRDQPARLQTMEAAIGWSYALLPEAEQRLFRALSVFVDGFTLAAAAHVIGSRATVVIDSVDPREPLRGADPAAIAGLGSLLRRNLLVEDTAHADWSEPRVRLLEPIRMFAGERLRESGEEPAVRRRHAAYFASLSEALDALTLGSDPEVWLPRLERELGNIRAAQEWALQEAPDLAVRIVCAVAQLWEIKGLLGEARQRVWAAMAVDAGSAPALRWFLRFWAATFALDLGDVAEAMNQAGDVLAIAEDHADAVGSGVGLAMMSRAIGAAANRHEEAAELARRAVGTLAPLGQDEWTGWAWGRLGIELHRLGQLEAAHDALQQSLTVRRRKPCAGCASYALASLAAVLADLGQSAASVEAFAESLDLAIRHQNHTLTLATLLGLADVIWRYGAAPDVARIALLLYGAAEALRHRHGIARERAAGEAIARWLAAPRSSLGDALVEAWIGDGGAAPLSEVVAMARALPMTTDRRAGAHRGTERGLLVDLGSLE